MTVEDSTVVCEGVSKSFRRRTALDGIDVRFDPGVTSLLGANGAGKTTLVSAIATVTRPDGGRISVAGCDLSTADGVSAARRQVGYLPQHFDLIGGASVHENAAYSAWCHGWDRALVDEQASWALAVVGLSDRRRERARAISGGQRQRLGIACAIAHRPQVLVLDEPTVSLDPIGRIAVRELIAELGRSTTVIMSTHLVDEVAALGGQAVVLREGTVAYSGSTDDLGRDGGSSGDRTRALEEALMDLAQ